MYLIQIISVKEEITYERLILYYELVLLFFCKNKQVIL